MLGAYADPNGLMLNGWPQQLDVVVATHGATPLAERLPKVMWRGRAEDEPRDEVRRALIMSRLGAMQGFCGSMSRLRC